MLVCALHYSRDMHAGMRTALETCMHAGVRTALLNGDTRAHRHPSCRGVSTLA